MNHFSPKLIAILIITFNGFFLASLITIGQIIADRKSPKTWLFLFLFSIFCLFQIHYIFFEIGLLGKYKIINIFPITAIFLLGPAILGITIHSVKESYSFNKKGVLHFVPAVISILISLLILYTTEYLPTKMIYGYYYNWHMSALGFLGSLFFAFYLFQAGHVLFNSDVLSGNLILKKPPVFVAITILTFLVLAFFSDIAAVCFNSKFFMELSLIILNFIIIFLFLIVFKYPDYYKTFHVIVKKEKEKRSHLKGIDLDGLSNKINSLMEKEKIYMDENLNLESMSDKVGINKHQLSQYMNHIIQENFTAFINRHRINAAKKILIQYPEENIINIAFEVGFKSKSTFNASFSKFEKTTPLAFKKQHLKK